MIGTARRGRGIAARLATALALTALALTACAPPGAEPDPGPGAGSSSSAGRDLRYHLYQAPTSFDPFNALQGADGEISALHFRPLVRSEQATFVPGLAKAWEPSSDAKTYTLTLQDTQWSDGTPFTSADVLFSLESYADPKTKSIFSGQLSPVAGFAEFQAGKAKELSGITAPDEHTVIIELAEPNAAFLANLVPLLIVPKHVYGSLDRAKFKGAKEFREPKVGIGPYVFSRWVTDDQIEFVPNPESDEPHPLDHVYAQYLAGDVARAQLETGEIDIAQLASADVASVQKTGKITVQKAPGTAVMSLYTALNSGKLADPKVRRAVLYAIDRQSIVDNVLAGNGTVAQSMLYQPDWAVPDDLITYGYDPGKAKQLLAEAGWKSDTVVNLDIVPGQADRDAVMNIIAGQLQAVGINAKLRPLQPAELTKLVEQEKFDLLITVLALAPGEPGTINVRFTCKGALNLSKYCNPQLDKELQAGIATTDQDERAKHYQAAARILNTDQPAMPLFVANQPWGSTARVKGFDPALGGLAAAHHWDLAS